MQAVAPRPPQLAAAFPAAAMVLVAPGTGMPELGLAARLRAFLREMCAFADQIEEMECLSHSDLFTIVRESV